MITLISLACDQFKSLKQVELRFPERGSVLIEGNNEAGKSTLFEAVYFALYGRPLNGDLKDVPGHGATTATVRLTLAVDATLLRIERRVLLGDAGGAQSRVRLVVESPGSEPEAIARVDAANRRIVMEMGGLDSDSLLNSCFVEQKKLERLEDLGRQGLQASLLKLLNLDKLTKLQLEFRFTVRDSEALMRAEKRLSLAQATAAIPRNEEDRSRTDRSLRAIALRRHAEDAERLAAQRASLEQEQAGAQERIGRATERIGRHDALQRTAADTDAAQGAMAELARMVRQQTELEDRSRQLAERERDELPQRAARVADMEELDRLSKDLAKQEQRVSSAVARASEDTAAVTQYRSDERQHAEVLDQQTKIETRLQQLEHQISAAAAIAEVELPAAQLRLKQLDTSAAELRTLTDLRRRREGRQEELGKLDERLRAADLLRTEIARLDADLAALRSDHTRAAEHAERLASAVRGHSAARLLRDWARLSGTAERVDAAAALLADARRDLGDARGTLAAVGAAQRAVRIRVLAGGACLAVGVLVGLVGVIGAGVPGGLAIALALVFGLGGGVLLAVSAGGVRRRAAELHAASAAGEDAERRVQDADVSLRVAAAHDGSSTADPQSVTRELQAAAVQLRAMDEPEPTTLAGALARAQQLEERLKELHPAGIDLVTATAGAQEAETSLARINAQLARVEGERGVLFTQRNGIDAERATHDRAAVAAELVGIEEDIEQRDRHVRTILEELGGPIEEQSVAVRLGQTRQHVEGHRAKLVEAEALRGERDGVASEQRRTAERLALLAARLNAVDVAVLEATAQAARAHAEALQRESVQARATFTTRCASAGVAADAAAVGESLGAARVALETLPVSYTHLTLPTKRIV